MRSRADWSSCLAPQRSFLRGCVVPGGSVLVCCTHVAYVSGRADLFSAEVLVVPLSPIKILSVK